MKQIDRSVKDIFGKLDNMFPNLAAPAITNPTTNNYKEFLKNAKDDNYYLERNLEPPRFELYKIARKLIIENTDKSKKPVPGIVTSDNLDEYMPVYDAMTLDEFDYELKRKIDEMKGFDKQYFEHYIMLSLFDITYRQIVSEDRELYAEYEKMSREYDKDQKQQQYNEKEKNQNQNQKNTSTLTTK
jgi:hypothetical protein